MLPVGRDLPPHQAKQVLASLPTARAVRETAVKRWGYRPIAREYLAVYKRAISGEVWR